MNRTPTNQGQYKELEDLLRGTTKPENSCCGKIINP
jgi:hypothetical protein